MYSCDRWHMCISSSTDDVIGPSRTIVCVDVIVFCKEERRGCWSVEAFGEEVLVYVRSLMMRVPSRPSNGDAADADISRAA